MNVTQEPVYKQEAIFIEYTQIDFREFLGDVLEHAFHIRQPIWYYTNFNINIEITNSFLMIQEHTWCITYSFVNKMNSE